MKRTARDRLLAEMRLEQEETEYRRLRFEAKVKRLEAESAQEAEELAAAQSRLIGDQLRPGAPP